MARPISKAASILGYSGPDWYELSPELRKELREDVRNTQRRIVRFAGRSKDRRTGDYRPDDWETWEWDLYREARGL